MTGVAIVLGTRPERIKCEPIIADLSGAIPVSVIETGQHTTLLDSAQVRTSHLPTTTLGKDLHGLPLGVALGDMISELTRAFEDISPALVMVQGDTSSSLAGAIAGKMFGTRVAHVEAGLRTHNRQRPWPEEMVRAIIGQLADLHFAPTQLARKNLLAEGVDPGAIVITGNTSVDVVQAAIDELGVVPIPPSEQEAPQPNHPVLVTLHRREAHGQVRLNALKNLEILLENHNLTAEIISHPNPSVLRDIDESRIVENPRVKVIEPLAQRDLLLRILDAPFVVSDSGGIQEEAPSLGKTVFIARDETERPEAVQEGLNFLCGASLEDLEMRFLEWQALEKPSSIQNPYGDGQAGKRIASHILEYLAL